MDILTGSTSLEDNWASPNNVGMKLYELYNSYFTHKTREALIHFTQNMNVYNSIADIVKNTTDNPKVHQEEK